MTIFLRAVAVVLLLAIPVIAEELPKELLLICEGDMNAVMDVPKPESRNAKFRISLHLKDGSVSDTATNVVEGAGTDPSFKCRLILNLALRDTGFGTSMTAFM